LDIAKQIEWLRDRLQKPLPGTKGQERMAARVRPMPSQIPEDARPSAVLSLLFPKDNALNLLLIRRFADGKAHSGQIGFPGGKQDKTDADLKATALREANEEVGILSTDVDILGALTPLYIPVSNFNVYPFVAYAEKQLSYNLSTREVDAVFEIPVAELMRPENKIVTDVVSPAMPGIVLTNVKAYKMPDDSILWGATAMIISELETILEEYSD
jgi:8-oxo-dGTP pyrophosphatase MutT (NUDIX family)